PRGQRTIARAPLPPRAAARRIRAPHHGRGSAGARPRIHPADRQERSRAEAGRERQGPRAARVHAGAAVRGADAGVHRRRRDRRIRLRYREPARRAVDQSRGRRYGGALAPSGCQSGAGMASLDLALVGNGTIAGLLTEDAEVTWACFPRFDGDPVFNSLLGGSGSYRIELLGKVKSEQSYALNTPMLVTRMYDADGGAVEITDFAPRFRQHGRVYCPVMLVRQVRRIAGKPRIRVQLRAAQEYGKTRATTTYGSNHIRYVGKDLVLRLTTDAAVTAVLEENAFFVDDAITLILGPDETIQGSVDDVGDHLL